MSETLSHKRAKRRAAGRTEVPISRNRRLVQLHQKELQKSREVDLRWG
jgi:hypothetical protein